MFFSSCLRVHPERPHFHFSPDTGAMGGLYRTVPRDHLPVADVRSRLHKCTDLEWDLLDKRYFKSLNGYVDYHRTIGGVQQANDFLIEHRNQTKRRDGQPELRPIVPGSGIKTYAWVQDHLGWYPETIDTLGAENCFTLIECPTGDRLVDFPTLNRFVRQPGNKIRANRLNENLRAKAIAKAAAEAAEVKTAEQI